MTKQILFIQGGGAEGVHDRWDNELVASLNKNLGRDYDIRYPLMPNEADPEYAAWKLTIEDALGDLPDNAILVAHSIGATILINAITETPTRNEFSGIFLIAAPFIGPGGWPSEDIKPSPDLGERLPRKTPVYLYQGSEDETTPSDHVDLYKKTIPSAHVRRLEHRDHQLNNDLSEVAADILSLD